MTLRVRRQCVRRTTRGRHHLNITHVTCATTDEIYEIKCAVKAPCIYQVRLAEIKLDCSVRDHFSTCPRLGIAPHSDQSVMDFQTTPLMPAPSAAAPNELRCKYPSKVCENVRAIKRDGELHRFCDFHRLKANMNQRRLENRRRTERMMNKLAMTNAESCYSDASTQIERDAHLSEADVISLPAIDWDDVDLVILNDLLCSDSSTVEECEAALLGMSSAVEVLSMSIKW